MLEITDSSQYSRFNIKQARSKHNTFKWYHLGPTQSPSSFSNSNIFTNLWPSRGKRKLNHHQQGHVHHEDDGSNEHYNNSNSNSNSNFINSPANYSSSNNHLLIDVPVATGHGSAYSSSLCIIID